MVFDSALADIRFGTGLSPARASPASADAMMAALAGPDAMAARFPIPTYSGNIAALLTTYAALRKDIKRTNNGPESRKAMIRFQKEMRGQSRAWVRQQMLRGMQTTDGFRERLVWFWADHFTAVGGFSFLQQFAPGYVEEAIRPHVTGHFADLLWAADTHPFMQIYLDQHKSVGPNSTRARRKPEVGLNENLAREMLELHTLGVDGAYTQIDVTALARLLTGLGVAQQTKTVFRPAWAEPGQHIVLGRSYGGNIKERARDIRRFVDDVARHPTTHLHLARKLAVHFVSDTPSHGLVSDIAGALDGSGGDLMAAYGALLAHPSAWDMAPANVKPPFDFMVSALRALGVTPAAMHALNARQTRLTFEIPMQLMGQNWQRALGPDGWPEEDARWITPQGLAGRIQWAMTAPETLCDVLPDPRDLVATALGARAPAPVVFAARAAETDWEGVGLILSAPAFQRR